MHLSIQSRVDAQGVRAKNDPVPCRRAGSARKKQHESTTCVRVNLFPQKIQRFPFHVMKGFKIERFAWEVFTFSAPSGFGFGSHFWIDFRSFLGSILDRFWIDFGSILGAILDRFWSDFGAILGAILVKFFIFFFISILNRFWIDFGSILGSKMEPKWLPNWTKSWKVYRKSDLDPQKRSLAWFGTQNEAKLTQNWSKIRKYTENRKLFYIPVQARMISENEFWFLV